MYLCACNHNDTTMNEGKELTEHLPYANLAYLTHSHYQCAQEFLPCHTDQKIEVLAPFLLLFYSSPRLSNRA